MVRFIVLLFWCVCCFLLLCFYCFTSVSYCFVFSCVCFAESCALIFFVIRLFLCLFLEQILVHFACFFALYIYICYFVNLDFLVLRRTFCENCVFIYLGFLSVFFYVLF